MVQRKNTEKNNSKMIELIYSTNKCSNYMCTSLFFNDTHLKHMNKQQEDALQPPKILHISWTINVPGKIMRSHKTMKRLVYSQPYQLIPPAPHPRCLFVDIDP